jgi:6-phosphogluconolactonase (cycloisomerase 2 family)
MNYYQMAAHCRTAFGESQIMASANRRAGFHLYRTHACAFILLSAATALLGGCGNFFSCEGKTSCPSTCVASSTVTCPTTGTGSGSGAGSSTDDFAYVANSATSSSNINDYNLGSGTLTAATDATQNLTYSPVSMVVTPADTFLYAASDPNISTGNIYAYSIGTGGALTVLGGGNAQIEENDAALAVSPDGQWLFTLPTDGVQVNVYPINTSTGALSQLAGFYGLVSAPTGAITPVSISVAPTGEYFAAALATGGANVYSFDTTTGPQGGTPVTINPGSSASGIYALAFDSSNNLYCAGTAGLEVFSISSAGAVTPLKTYSLGNAPRSIAINSTSTYVFVGNESDGTISAFSIGTGGVLTPVSGSPFTGPTLVNSLAIDSTGAYLIASGYNATTGIQLFSIGTTGALSSVGTAATGTSNLIPGAIAATH